LARTPYPSTPDLLQLLSSRFVWQGENNKVEYTYGWYSASAGNKYYAKGNNKINEA
jgi:hypothetical protein